MFFKELQRFSKENWWIYAILGIASGIVIWTGKGNFIEIIGLFTLNLFANIAVMAAIGSYSKKQNKAGSLFHFTSTSIFTIISIYSFIRFHEPLYLIWQICFLLGMIKAVVFYNLGKDLKFLHPISIGMINVIILIGFFLYSTSFNFDSGIARILTGIGFSFTTTGLVSTNDSFRYWGNYIGSSLITVGSAIGTYISYLDGDLNGVSLGYFILTMTAFIYFSKLLPQYIRIFTKN